jgi:hypothetical protein
MIILSLCTLLQLFAWHQTAQQQRLHNAYWSSEQMEQWARSAMLMAAHQFDQPQAPLRWESQAAFEQWRSTGSVCAPACAATMTLAHDSRWRVTYDIEVRHLERPSVTSSAQVAHSTSLANPTQPPPVFVYTVTASVQHQQTGVTRQLRGVWRSDEARWVSVLKI